MTDAAHVDTIDMLARANNRFVPGSSSRSIWKSSLTLKHARIRDYLVLLTSKHIREVLRGESKRKLSKSSPPKLPQPA